MKQGGVSPGMTKSVISEYRLQAVTLVQGDTC
jgi:hypothetical protein